MYDRPGSAFAECVFGKFPLSHLWGLGGASEPASRQGTCTTFCTKSVCWDWAATGT